MFQIPFKLKGIFYGAGITTGSATAVSSLNKLGRAANMYLFLRLADGLMVQHHSSSAIIIAAH